MYRIAVPHLVIRYSHKKFWFKFLRVLYIFLCITRKNRLDKIISHFLYTWYLNVCIFAKDLKKLRKEWGLTLFLKICFVWCRERAGEQESPQLDWSHIWLQTKAGLAFLLSPRLEWSAERFYLIPYKFSVTSNILIVIILICSGI